MSERNIRMFVDGTTYGFINTDTGEIIADGFSKTEALVKAEEIMGYQNPRIDTFFRCVADYKYNKTIDEKLVLIDQSGVVKDSISTRGIYMHANGPLMEFQSLIGRVDETTVELQLL